MEIPLCKIKRVRLPKQGKPVHNSFIIQLTIQKGYFAVAITAKGIEFSFQINWLCHGCCS